MSVVAASRPGAVRARVGALRQTGRQGVGIDHAHPRTTGPVRELRRLLATHWRAHDDLFAFRMREQFPLWPGRDATAYRNVSSELGLNGSSSRTSLPSHCCTVTAQ